MPDILVRDLDSHTIDRLKLSAKQHGRSLQREVKAILEETVPMTMREARAVSEKWQKRLKGRTFSDSAKSIREDRER
jgi:plasmid stability protein